MKQYLEEIFGKENVKEEKLKELKLPLYLKENEYSIMTIYGVKFLLLEVNIPFAIIVKKEILQLLEDRTKLPIVLGFRLLTPYQRKSLIDHSIMFVEKNRQVFMPYLGIALKGLNMEKLINTEKFTPQTQVCALFFIYSYKDYGYTVNDIANIVNLNNMAISRGLNVLLKLNAIESINEGPRKYYYRKISAKEYYEIISDKLISPILEEQIIDDSEYAKKIKAGYSALEVVTDLVDNRVKTYAISKQYRLEDKARRETKELVIDKVYRNKNTNKITEYKPHHIAKLQIWKYDPNLFARHGIVDIISLIESFKNKNIDERTEMAIEDLLKRVLEE